MLPLPPDHSHIPKPPMSSFYVDLPVASHDTSSVLSAGVATNSPTTPTIGTIPNGVRSMGSGIGMGTGMGSGNISSLNVLQLQISQLQSRSILIHETLNTLVDSMNELMVFVQTTRLNQQTQRHQVDPSATRLPFSTMENQWTEAIATTTSPLPGQSDTPPPQGRVINHPPINVQRTVM